RSVMELLPSLLPLDASLRVEDLAMDTEAHTVTVKLQAIATSCLCPSCQLPADRIHSHYRRTVADLPWAELVVRLSLHVRKFFCDNAACVRKVFTERLPSLLAPWARRTVRLTQQQQHLGLALGGNPSASLSAKLDCSASRNTFLRLLR